MPWPKFWQNRPASALTPSYPNVVFFAADARYLQLAWLAAGDAAAQPGRSYDVVLLVLRGAGLRLPAPPPGCAVLEVELPRWVKTWPVPAHMSTANYIRLFAADLWLAQWQRALYLDSDVLIGADLTSLFEIDLGGALAALVEDCGFCRRDAAAAATRAVLLRAIGLDPRATYFNSGVMLFDIAPWRQADVTSKLAGFKDIQASKSGSVDQDFINFVVRGRVLELSPRWNFQTHYFDLGLEPVVRPGIAHYLDILKPWRDPEWNLAYDPGHATAFADRLAQDRVFGPGLGVALRKRAHPDSVFAAHVENIHRERAGLRARVTSHIATSVDRYADLTPTEKQLWSHSLRVPA
jgi:hypothetical protein